ncbi:hypothetical protein [Bacillus marinisedimentorum]|uniref:hypothetical protein n=1 Tax=Bacillus marinisedimentorum TaxID=1821260 RepID=UPI0014715D86|nr:hypothetical protein [Bacillus marinisedimentorum]
METNYYLMDGQKREESGMKIVFYENSDIQVIVGSAELKGNLTIEQIQTEGEKKAKELSGLLGREIGFMIDMNGRMEQKVPMG